MANLPTFLGERSESEDIEFPTWLCWTTNFPWLSSTSYHSHFDHSLGRSATCPSIRKASTVATSFGHEFRLVLNHLQLHPTWNAVLNRDDLESPLSILSIQLLPWSVSTKAWRWVGEGNARANVHVLNVNLIDYISNATKILINVHIYSIGLSSCSLPHDVLSILFFRWIKLASYTVSLNDLAPSHALIQVQKGDVTMWMLRKSIYQRN